MAPRIHVIERMEKIKKVEGDVHESCCWDVTPQQAQALVGGDIYFHEKQKSLSFFGGRILGYRIYESSDQYSGRIIFLFEYSRAHKKFSAGEERWTSYEKKIVS